ncbi:hypothetical protein GYH30_003098 [Glycine max]|uniref:Uncharacterized protein n=1 Tax=Glycine max TaxID=3847 RepID=K7K6L1_SOYBN|nr:hypothetical protein JHK87_003105 [Glycine soja]KAH1058864.1 hypothetical protein GYH30_003098 [Glycine max]
MQQILNNKDIHQIQNILLFNTNDDDDDAQIWKFALNGVVPTRFVFLPELGFVQKEFNALQQLALFCHNHLENPRHISFRFDHAVSVCLTLEKKFEMILETSPAMAVSLAYQDLFEWMIKPLCKSDHRLLLILQDRERSSPGSFPCFLADSRGLQSFSAKLLGSWLELGSGDSLFLR